MAYQIIHSHSEWNPEYDLDAIEIEDSDSNEVIAAKAAIIMFRRIKNKGTLTLGDMETLKDAAPWVESAFEVLRARDLL